MLYHLLYPLAARFSVLNVLRYPSFRIVAAGLTALLLGLLLTLVGFLGKLAAGFCALAASAACTTSGLREAPVDDRSNRTVATIVVPAPAAAAPADAAAAAAAGHAALRPRP
mgnify:CR=1 FL=1